MNYFERLKNIHTNQKQGDIYYLYLTRYISAPISALLSFTPVTPNMATLSMFFFGILGAVFFSFGSATDYMIGRLCFILLIVADTVDGELARFKGISSLFGDYFDRLAHYTTNPMMYLGLGLGIYSTYQEIIIIYIAILVTVSHLIDDISRDLLISCGLSDGKSRKEEKEVLSVMKGSNFRLLISYTASHAAFFHLIILMAGLDIMRSNMLHTEELLITHCYIVYFSVIAVARLLFRIPKISSLKTT